MSSWILFKKRSTLKGSERVCPLLTNALMIGTSLGKLPYLPRDVVVDDPIVGVCPGELVGVCGMENLCSLNIGKQVPDVNTGKEE